MILNVNSEIYLKTLDMSDVEERFKVIENNREHLKKWLGWLDNMLTIEDAQVHTETTMKELEDKSNYNFGIYYNNKFAGIIAIKDISYRNQKAEIGYWLDKEFTGKGIMTQCCRVVINFAYETLNLNKITILTATENYKSQAIPKRLNFDLEGTLKEYECLYGKYVDNYIFSMLKRNWK